MAGLAKAATAVGLESKGVQVSRKAFSDIEMPAIAWISPKHYVAVLRIQGFGESAIATIRDPNAVRDDAITLERLLLMGRGYLLLVKR